jgi:DNA-binding NarL/FixJ family response regulator
MNKTSIDKIKIILVEDHTLTRFGLKTAFEEAPTIEVVGEAETGEEGITMVSEIKPDVVLMDLGLPDMNGIDATQKIKAADDNTKVIILTSHNNEEEVWAALGAGANAYCLKDIEPDRLIHVVESVYDGAAWLDPAIAHIVLKCISEHPGKKQGTSTVSETQPEKPLLTERELEVLKLLVDGNSNAEIAKKLVVSIHTAKAHVCSILQKLSVDDRTQAAIKALKDGIV